MPPIFLVLLLAYALGCLSAGFYLARWKGLDLRQAGSGSTGARNVGRHLGPWAFALTFFLDLAKGLAAVLLARLLAPGPWAAPSAMLLVVAGHVWPIQLRFHGGRGISPAVGALMALSPLLTAVVAIPLLIGWAAARNFKRGGMLAVVVSPVLAWFLRRPLGLTWQDCTEFSLLAVFLVGTHLHTLKARTEETPTSAVNA
ncbi:MAG: glycerol-3-phosphate acyltransferase [Holophaga sp.]|nr:glycerol-3-phosphate acyltransferase [Holophaga sp.]